MFSSIDQLRTNLSQVDITRMIDSVVTDRIQHADDDIVMDLSKYVNFNNATVSAGYVDKTTTPLFPIFLNHLSQYKTCEHCLVKLYGTKRTVDQISDIQFWCDEYDKLIQRVKTNQTPIALTNGTPIGFGTFRISTNKKGVLPALGEGKYGQFESDADIARDRAQSPNGMTRIEDDMHD